MDEPRVELDGLQEARARAADRVEAVEADWRAAVSASQDASAALAEAERGGVSAARRNRLEQELAAAKSRQAEPWPERVDGAKAAVRDADVAIRQFVAEHLAELVAGLEEQGRTAAEAVNVAASDLIASVAERERIAAAIRQLITRVHAPGPGDVVYGIGEEAARAASVLVAAGGEVAPRLDRDREPWNHLLAAEVETVPAA